MKERESLPRFRELHFARVQENSAIFLFCCQVDHFRLFL
jgi:hypothetical protein